MFAFLNTAGDVVSVGQTDRTASVVQALVQSRTGTDPGPLTKVASAPDSLVGIYAHRPKGLPAYRHQKVSGDGTDISHYAEVPHLDELKAFRNAEVDARTTEIFARGFTYDGKKFSLSTRAQAKWTAAYVGRSMMTVMGKFPLVVNTIDDKDTYSVADEDRLELVYQTMIGTGAAIVESDTALKADINAATTRVAIDAIEDTR